MSLQNTNWLNVKKSINMSSNSVIEYFAPLITQAISEKILSVKNIYQRQKSYNVIILVSFL